MGPPFRIQHMKYLVIDGVIVEVNGFTQEIGLVIQTPRDPLHLKGNSRWEQRLKIKSVKFCDSTAVLNNTNHTCVINRPSNSSAFKTGGKGKQRKIYGPKLPPRGALRAFSGTPILVKNLAFVINENTAGAIGRIRIQELNRQL